MKKNSITNLESLEYEKMRIYPGLFQQLLTMLAAEDQTKGGLGGGFGAQKLVECLLLVSSYSFPAGHGAGPVI